MLSLKLLCTISLEGTFFKKMEKGGSRMPFFSLFVCQHKPIKALDKVAHIPRDLSMDSK